MSDQPFDPRPMTRAARNERRKLLANSLNTAGLAIFGLGVLTPMITTGLAWSSAFKTTACCAILLVLHSAAQRLMKGVED
jgi:NAD(P)H-hydrate repair Nnr-like enzyme with NAD(P)H-hydrate dehydratase domain